MRSNREFAALFDEFPQLERKDIVLEKELYAHFGLMFFTISLVEQSLIDFFVFARLGRCLARGSLGNRTERAAALDQAYAEAKSLSLGELIEAVRDIPELSDEIAEIRRVELNRDYFAKFFFRDEASCFSGSNRVWLLLVRLRQVRLHAVDLEERLKPRFDALCGRYRLPVRSGEEAKAAVLAGGELGWKN